MSARHKLAAGLPDLLRAGARAKVLEEVMALCTTATLRQVLYFAEKELRIRATSPSAKQLEGT